MLVATYLRHTFGRHLTTAAAIATAALFLTPGSASAEQAPVSLGDAAPFGVLAGNAVVNSDMTSITGDLGVSPGNSVIGFPPGTVSGTIHAGDAVAANAKADIVAAYNDLAGRTPVVTVPAELGGTTQPPGVYDTPSGSFEITGTLTLDAQGDPDAVFIFTASSLTTVRVSNISLVRGAQADNVFWQISGSASLGIYSTFRGNVLARGTVRVSGGAAVHGRLFALDDVVGVEGTGSVPATRVTVPNDPPTRTTLRGPLLSREGQPVTFTATVRSTTSSVVPAGEVVFKDGSTIIGSAYHSSLSPAIFTTSDLSPGRHRISAIYLGGDTFDGEALIHFAPSRSRMRSHYVLRGLAIPSTSPGLRVTSDLAVGLTPGVSER